MKTLTVHLLALALAAAFVADEVYAGATAIADTSPPPPQGGEHHHGDHHWRHHGFGSRLPLEEFDLNKDGRITHAEIDQALRARFDAADANHDGQLDAKEFAVAMPEHHRPPPDGDAPPPPPRGEMHDRRFEHRGPPDPAEMLKHVDWNLDGKVSFEEFAAPIRQMAMRADRNGDGVIEGDELQTPPFPPGAPGGPGAPPPHGPDTP